MLKIGQIIVTTLGSWVVLFGLTKLTGNRQLHEMSLFDYVCSITIGSIAAELASELENPLYPLTALIVFGLATYLLAILSLKSPALRKAARGTPQVLFNGGTIYRRNLRRAKLSTDEFLMLCRCAGYFDLSQIQTVLFECNGTVSVLPKAENRPATPADWNMKCADESVFQALVLDGHICQKALALYKKEERWLNRQLSAAGFQNWREVCVALYDGRTFQAYGNGGNTPT